MKRYLFLILSAILTFSYINLNGQLASGLSLSEYSGINGAFVNPAQTRSYPLKWDVHLGGFHLFAHTDYAFVQESNLFHLLNNVSNIRQAPLITDPSPLDPNALYFDFDRELEEKSAAIHLDIIGPGILWNFENFTAGLFTRLRSSGGSHAIPSALSYNGVQTSRISVENNIPQSSTAQGLMWSEIGLSFSSDQLVPMDGLSIGVNLKYLRAHQGAYFSSTDEFNYIRNSMDSLTLIGPQVEFGLSNQIVNESDNIMAQNGSGLGLDIGATYELPLGKLGFSILDIGSVKINNAEVYTLQSSQTLSLDTETLTDNISISEVVDELDSQLTSQLNQVTTLQSGSHFNIGLPTRIHLDFNYPLRKDISLNAAIDQRLPIFKNSLEAENVFTIMPKYETKWIMIAAPISVYEYSSVRLGFAARLGVLTIGTDHLSSLFGRSNLNGSSLYASLRVFPLGNSQRSKNSKRGKEVNCPGPKI